jgi:hypothetical protein
MAWIAFTKQAISGSEPEVPPPDRSERLLALDELRDLRAISEDQFATAVTRLLDTWKSDGPPR